MAAKAVLDIPEVVYNTAEDIPYRRGAPYVNIFVA